MEKLEVVCWAKILNNKDDSLFFTSPKLCPVNGPGFTSAFFSSTTGATGTTTGFSFSPVPWKLNAPKMPGFFSSAGVLSCFRGKFLAWNVNPAKGLGFASGFFSSTAGCSLVELITGVLVKVRPPNDILLSDEDLGVPKLGNSGADCNLEGEKVKGALAEVVSNVVVTGAKENVVLAPPNIKPEVETAGAAGTVDWTEPKTNPGVAGDALVAATETGTADWSKLEMILEDEAGTPNLVAVPVAGATSNFGAADPDAEPAGVGVWPKMNPVVVGPAGELSARTVESAGTPNLNAGKMDDLVSTAPGFSISQATHLTVSGVFVT